MLLCTPYVSPSPFDYKAYATALRKRGNLLGHTHIVVSTVENEAEAYEFGSELSDLFLSSSFVALAAKERGPIQLANDLFRAACRRVATYKHAEGELPNPAMLYMAPDYAPTTNGWLDLIQSEYYLRQAPLVMGRFSEDNLIVGPVVLGREFFKSSGLLPFIPDNVHYRNYLQHELASSSVSTNLIGPGSKDSVLRQTPSKKTA